MRKFMRTSIIIDVADYIVEATATIMLIPQLAEWRNHKYSVSAHCSSSQYETEKHRDPKLSVTFMSCFVA